MVTNSSVLSLPPARGGQVSLYKNQLGAGSVLRLFPSLNAYHALRRLDLGENGLDEGDAQALADLIRGRCRCRESTRLAGVLVAL